MEKILVIGSMSMSIRSALDTRIAEAGLKSYNFVNNAMKVILDGDYVGFVFAGIGFTHDEQVAAQATGRPYVVLQLESENWPQVLDKFLQGVQKKIQHLTSVASKKSILVVDDEPGIRSLLYDLLAGTEFSVTMARNGQEAKSLLETQGQFDLIISDIEMPLMDGCELHRWWKESSCSTKAKFIFVSTQNPKNRGIEECIWLVKPFQIADMLSTVNGVLAMPQPE